MAFKVLFLAHAPDGNYMEHNSIINTGMYKLYTYIVKTQLEALKISKELYEKDGIDSIILCPGFSHKDVSEIFEMLNGEVSVNVSRGDGPSSVISKKARDREGYSKKG